MERHFAVIVQGSFRRENKIVSGNQPENVRWGWACTKWFNVLRAPLPPSVSASLVCCLNIVVKLCNSCIFKWLSRLVNKPWRLYRLGWKRNKCSGQHRAHTRSACLRSARKCQLKAVIVACQLFASSMTTQCLERLFLKEWKKDIFQWYLNCETAVLQKRGMRLFIFW